MSSTVSLNRAAPGSKTGQLTLRQPLRQLIEVIARAIVLLGQNLGLSEFSCPLVPKPVPVRVCARHDVYIRGDRTPAP